MSHIISITNQKGGVGKSTTAYNLQSALISKGYKVLLIDLDPQGNVSYALGSEHTNGTAYEFITHSASFDDVVYTLGGKDIIPAGDLLANVPTKLNQTGKEYKLTEALESVKSKYDYIVIDTPPTLGVLTINSLVASDTVVIPSQADIFSIQGIGQLSETINIVKKYCNKSLTIRGILLTRFNKRTVLGRSIADAMEDTARTLGTFVYNTPIRECISLKEAQARRIDIFSYAPSSNAAVDYTAFCDELLERISNE